MVVQVAEGWAAGGDLGGVTWGAKVRVIDILGPGMRVNGAESATGEGRSGRWR